MKNRNYYCLLVILTSLLIIDSNNVFAQWSGNFSVESQLFKDDGLIAGQKNSNLSFALTPEFATGLFDDNVYFKFMPFFRLDQVDDERTHFDIREFYFEYAGDDVELRVGVNTVFWGVTESQHLVDVINQTDAVENLDGEDKLGQPMVNLTFVKDFGILDLFLLPYFRERSFTGSKGRFSFSNILKPDSPIYESDEKEKAIDFAFRFSKTIGSLDLGISNFYGTSREPLFTTVISEDTGLSIYPEYERINQIGLDLQYTSDAGLMLKFEGINRTKSIQDYHAYTAGFEYTFYNVNKKGLDVGVIAEYMFDERGNNSTNPFNNDLFVGSRLAFNDVQSTDAVFGFIKDTKLNSTLFRLEGNRRLFANYKISIEYFGFLQVDKKDFMYNFRKDSKFQIEIFRYF